MLSHHAGRYRLLESDTVKATGKSVTLFSFLYHLNYDISPLSAALDVSVGVGDLLASFAGVGDSEPEHGPEHTEHSSEDQRQSKVRCEQEQVGER